MLEPSPLEELIEQNRGVVLHRKRVVTAFSHLPEGPLFDLLFKMTRSPLRNTKSIRASRAAKLINPTSVQTGTIVQRGMVDYRRERSSASVARQTAAVPLPSAAAKAGAML